MVDLLYCELMKLKRSRMLLISILGAMVAPGMLLVDVLKIKASNPGTEVSFNYVFSSNNMYMTLMFGLIAYAVFAAYLFSREYTENTLKVVLTIPISKTAFLVSKSLILLAWILSLTTLSWIFAFLAGLICHTTNLSLNLLIQSYLEAIGATTLLFLTLSPIMFLAIWSKGIVIPVVVTAAIAMGNVVLLGEDWAALFPWTSIYLLAAGRVSETGYPMELVIGIIAVTALGGFIASIVYFIKEDVK